MPPILAAGGEAALKFFLLYPVKTNVFSGVVGSSVQSRKDILSSSVQFLCIIFRSSFQFRFIIFSSSIYPQ